MTSFTYNAISGQLKKNYKNYILLYRFKDQRLYFLIESCKQVDIATTSFDCPKLDNRF